MRLIRIFMEQSRLYLKRAGQLGQSEGLVSSRSAPVLKKHQVNQLRYTKGSGLADNLESYWVNLIVSPV